MSDQQKQKEPRWASMDGQHPAGVPVVKNHRYWLYGEERADGWHITGVRQNGRDGLDEVHIPAEVDGKPVKSFRIGWTYDPEWPDYVEKLYFPDCIPGVDGRSLRYVRNAVLIATDRPCYREENKLLLTLDGKQVVTCLMREEVTERLPKRILNMLPQQDLKELQRYLYRRRLSLWVPDGVEVIGEAAFADCDVSYVYMPDSLREIGDFTFEDSKLVEAVIPEGVKKIGCYAFQRSGLMALYLPDGLEELGEGAFSDTALIEATIPAGIRKLEGTFAYCSYLSRVHLPDGLETIGDATFCICEKLRHVNIPATVTAIGRSAFRKCEALTQITLPDGLREIHDDAFARTGMAEVVLPAAARVIKAESTELFDMDVEELEALLELDLESDEPVS